MNTYYSKTACLLVLSRAEQTRVIIWTTVQHLSEKLHQHLESSRPDSLPLQHDPKHDQGSFTSISSVRLSFSWMVSGLIGSLMT